MERTDTKAPLQNLPEVRIVSPESERLAHDWISRHKKAFQGLEDDVQLYFLQTLSEPNFWRVLRSQTNKVRLEKIDQDRDEREFHTHIKGLTFEYLSYYYLRGITPHDITVTTPHDMYDLYQLHEFRLFSWWNYNHSSSMPDLLLLKPHEQATQIVGAWECKSRRPSSGKKSRWQREKLLSGENIKTLFVDSTDNLVVPARQLFFDRYPDLPQVFSFDRENYKGSMIFTRKGGDEDQQITRGITLPISSEQIQELAACFFHDYLVGL